MDLRQKLIALYLHTCWLDVHSLKPGNVSVYGEVKDLKVEDFLISAKVSADPMTARHACLGERILSAAQATYQATDTNTNLGMILLIAPMIHAVYTQNERSLPGEKAFRRVLTDVIEQSTIEDAELVYQAIRLMKPGGMGREKKQDIFEKPDVTLLETMQIASKWDGIAAQYSNNFEEVLNFGVPHFRSLMRRWKDEKWATTGLFLSYLSQYHDSLIKRKYGLLKAREISDMIRDLGMGLCHSDSPGRYETQLLEIDIQLKRGLINPGTTADLTAASVFASGLLNKP